MSQLISIDNALEPREYLNQQLSSQGDGTGKIEQGVAAKAITSASNADPNVYTLVAHGFVDNDFVTVQNEAGSTSANGLRKVTAKTDDTFQLTDLEGNAIASNGTYTGGTMDVFPAFVVEPAANETYYMTRINGFCHDGTYNSIHYFGLGAALANGIEIKIYEGNDIIKVVTSNPIKKFLHWSLNSGVDSGNESGGAGLITQALIRYTLAKAKGPLKLKGANQLQSGKGQILVVLVQDDLDDLLGQELGVQGTIVVSD